MFGEPNNALAVPISEDVRRDTVLEISHNIRVEDRRYRTSITRGVGQLTVTSARTADQHSRSVRPVRTLALAMTTP